MLKDLKELLKKKALKGEFMDEKTKSATENVIGDLDDMAEEAMSKNMKKVTVASDSEEGLKKGLDKAEEVIENIDMEGDKMEEDMDDEMMSSKERAKEESYSDSPDYEEMDEDHEDMSLEEIDEMMAMLKDKKSRLVMSEE